MVFVPYRQHLRKQKFIKQMDETQIYIHLYLKGEDHIIIWDYPEGFVNTVAESENGKLEFSALS